MKKVIITLTVIFFATPIFAETYVVEKVISGSILQLSNGEIVKLIGVDVPEEIDRRLPEPSAEAVEQAKRWDVDLGTLDNMAKQSTDFVKGLIKEGQSVELEFDVDKKDKDGNLLGYVWYDSSNSAPESELVGIVNLHDSFMTVPMGLSEELMHMASFGSYRQSVFLNASIINAGYAYPMHIPPNVRYEKLFEKLNQEAKAAKKGLYSFSTDKTSR